MIDYLLHVAEHCSKSDPSLLILYRNNDINLYFLTVEFAMVRNSDRLIFKRMPKYFTVRNSVVSNLNLTPLSTATG